MKIVSKVVGTGHASMPIIDSEESWLLPLSCVMFRFRCIQDDSDSVFVVCPTRTLVCAGGVAFNNAISFDRVLGRLVVRKSLYELWDFRMCVHGVADISRADVVLLGLDKDLLLDHVIVQPFGRS